MRGGNDRNAEKAVPDTVLDPTEARDELIRLSGAFSALGRPSSKDIERLSARGFGAPGRLLILSHLLFPLICSIIGRGLTLEEMGHLSGVDQTKVKSALRSSAIKGSMMFTPQQADMTEFVKVAVPLKVTYRTEKGTERIVTENMPLLARRKLVKEIERKGYITNEGKVIKHDYLALLPGPPPTFYLFREQRDVARDAMGERWGSVMTDGLADNAGASRAIVETRIAQLEFFKAIVLSDHAPTLFEHMAGFLHSSHDNVRWYAVRYRALNDRATFKRIDRLADALEMFAECIDMLRQGGGEGLRELVDETNRMLEGLKSMYDRLCSE